MLSEEYTIETMPMAQVLMLQEFSDNTTEMKIPTSTQTSLPPSILTNPPSSKHLKPSRH